MVTIALFTIAALLLVVGFWLSRSIRNQSRLISTATQVSFTEFHNAQSSLFSASSSLKDSHVRIEQLRDKLAQVQPDADKTRDLLSVMLTDSAGSLGRAIELMELMKTGVKSNIESASTANQLAHDSHGLAIRGRHVLRDTIEAMSAISDSSKQISEITNMIDSIAFETNLLALNAAVEAARSGEQGKGFAVVATEVRNLAQRSAGFAREIKAQIESSVKRVNAGVLLADESGNTLTNIVLADEQINELVSAIGDNTERQRERLSSMAQCIEEMRHSNDHSFSNVDHVKPLAQLIAA